MFGGAEPGSRSIDFTREWDVGKKSSGTSETVFVVRTDCKDVTEYSKNKNC